MEHSQNATLQHVANKRSYYLRSYIDLEILLLSHSKCNNSGRKLLIYIPQDFSILNKYRSIYDDLEIFMAFVGTLYLTQYIPDSFIRKKNPTTSEIFWFELLSIIYTLFTI